MVIASAITFPILLLNNQMPIGNNLTIEVITPNELASLLKISKAGVYRLVDKRQIPFHKVMGSLRFDRDEVLKYWRDIQIDPIGAQQHGSKKN